MPQIENEFLLLELDSSGNLLELRNKKSGRSIVRPHGLIRCILETPECLEFETRPYGNPRIQSGENTIAFRWESLADDREICYPISIDLLIRLEKNRIVWDVSMENQSDGAVLRECHCPVLAVRNSESPMCVVNSELVSTKIDDLPTFLKQEFTDYVAPDQKYIRHIGVYPGRTCSMNCFLLDWGTDGCYIGCHDASFEMTVHGYELEKDSPNVFLARLPFLRPGERRHENCLVTELYPGDWTVGAGIYRQWADGWFAAPRVPDHIRTMSGWQRIILHHQYGEYFFRYDDLERIYDNGAKAGIDTLFLFGWTSEGMDSGYPLYTPDPKQGGKESLKRNIAKVRAKGGHVILYYNGQLIDAASDFYRSGSGRRISIKRSDGTEHREFYNFSNTGTFLRTFGNKTFAVACPSSREWIEILKRHIDFAFEVGADSVFFDQLGLASYPCCDPSHGHPVPFTGLMNAKRDMLRELYEYTKAKDPEMGFGIECTTDQTISYTDFVHIFGHVAQTWDESWRITSSVPRLKSGAYLLKGAFPEAILSNRNIRDDSDVEFPVNRMLLLGSRSDVEIYRCRADISATPHYQEYLAKANALREKFSEILYSGVFRGCHDFSLDNPEIQANAFLLRDNLAVILTQSSRSEAYTEIHVPGYRLIRYDSVRGDVLVNGSVIHLPQDALALLLFRKIPDGNL